MHPENFHDLLNQQSRIPSHPVPRPPRRPSRTAALARSLGEALRRAASRLTARKRPATDSADDRLGNPGAPLL